MPITITPTPVTVVAGRIANHFGVGEIIDLVAAHAPAAALPPIWSWSVTSGSDRGHFSSNGNSARVILTSLISGTMTIKVEDRMNTVQSTLTLTIVAPSNWSLGPIQYNYHIGARAHAGFRAVIQVQNSSNVSFDNLEMREGNAMPQMTGWFASQPSGHHGQTFALAANWHHIGTARNDVALQGQVSPGHIGLTIDRVSSGSVAGPFTPQHNGTFKWRIPWTYRLRIPVAQAVNVNGTAVQLPDGGVRSAQNVVEHLETLVGNSMTMAKGGQSVTYNSTQAAVGDRATFLA